MTTASSGANRPRLQKGRPVFVIHSLAHALAAASAAGSRPIALSSAPGSACYAGVGWFLEILAETRKRMPEADVAAFLDCGDDAAVAIEALRAGAEGVRIRGAAADQVAEVAAALGARTNGPEGPVLDMRWANRETCLDFLASRNPQSRLLCS